LVSDHFQSIGLSPKFFSCSLNFIEPPQRFLCEGSDAKTSSDQTSEKEGSRGRNYSNFPKKKNTVWMMRPEDRIRIYWLVEALWVVAVILIFRSIEERKTAAMIASAGFIFIPLSVLIVEKIGGERVRALIWIGHLQFLIFFAIPIVILNFFSQGLGEIPFPITAQDFHKFSNWSYFLMIICTLVEQRRARTNAV
jgi:hypothetical protein